MSRRDDVFLSFNKYREETDDRVKLGIEMNRKGFSTITVKDKDGNCVPGVKMSIKQKRHEFLHGANIFMLDEMETEEKNNKYKEAFKDIFNAATVPFYWDALEPEQGKPRFDKNSPKIYRRPPIDLCLEYCEKYGITPKEHCLTYMNFVPDWVDTQDVNDTKRKLEKRYKACAERYADRIHGWEVVNELFCADGHGANTIFFREDDILEWSFKLAEKYFYSNELIVNEATKKVWDSFAWGRSQYYQMIERALAHNVRIDCVGMQYHVFRSPEEERRCHETIYNPKMLFDVLDLYAKLDRPIQITETTLSAYSNSAEDEDIQAKLLEQLYSIWFSHANVEAIIYWNLVDGYAAFAPQGDMEAGENFFHGGLMRFDLTKKPSYDMMDELFNRRWHTDTQAETNGEGIAKFKGFYGDYDIVIDGKKYEIKTGKKKDNEFEIII